MTERSADPVLVELFRHHAWANEKLYEFCETLPESFLGLSNAATLGSVRRILRHVLISDEWYLTDIKGEPRPQNPPRDAPVAMLTKRIRRSGAAYLEFLPSVRGDTWARWVEDGEELTMLASRLLLQAINHATEHREQVKLILTHAGLTPPELDGWAYDLEQPDRGGPV